MSDLRPARVPAPLVATAGYFLPRLMFLNARHAPQIHWGDVARALDGFPCDELDLSSAGFWDDWRERWVSVGEWHVGESMASTTVAGRARAHRSAAACFHWAEFMDFGDAARKLALRSRVRHHFRASLEGSDLDITEGHAQASSGPVPFWLVRPPAHRRPAGPLPCVVLSNGLDSMTEVEVLSLAEAFLERGVAALLFDGPGQGLRLGQEPLAHDMETVVAPLLDHLELEPTVDAGRLAFLGISFGGYLALRVAQHLGPRLRCVVNLSGGPRTAPFAGLPRRLKDDFLFAFGETGAEAMQRTLDAQAIDPTRVPDTDVLSVHGALDDIFPLADLETLDRLWAGRHRLVAHEREAHVCLTRIDSCVREAADWVTGRLAGGSIPSPRASARTAVLATSVSEGTS